jgi:cell division septation protein DedD
VNKIGVAGLVAAAFLLGSTVAPVSTSAGQDDYPYWGQNCENQGYVTWKTNRKRNVSTASAVINDIDSNLSQYQFAYKPKGKADIKINFVTKRKIKKKARSQSTIGLAVMRYDTRTNFFLKVKLFVPKNVSRQSNVQTLEHEAWHGVGIDHVTGRGSLMNPYLSAGDIGLYPDAKDYQLLKSLDNKCVDAPEPSPKPKPTVTKFPDPVPVPTSEPTPEPTSEPTPEPTPTPTLTPTAESTPETSEEPTSTPSPTLTGFFGDEDLYDPNCWPSLNEYNC